MPQIDVETLRKDMQDVLASREKSSVGDDAGLTSEEWAREWGTDRKTARERLRKLHTAGLLVAGRRNSTDISGRTVWIPVYRART